MSNIGLNTDDFFQHKYSKAGKSSSQIFAHLLGRANKISFIPKPPIVPTPNQTPKKIRPQPFSICLSREYVHKLQNAGRPNIQPGLYNPKYSVIQKKSDLGGKFSQEHKSIQREQNESQQSIDFSHLQTKRTKGFVDLKRQISRDQSNRQCNNSQNSSTHQMISLDTIKARPRSAHFRGSGHSLNINKFNCFQSFYDADYQVGKRKISFVGTSFEKQTKRQAMVNKSFCLRENSIYQYDQFSSKNSIVQPNTKKIMIDFNKILGRSCKNDLAVPSHMSKTNRSRIMLETLNQKMLELNASSQ